MSLTLLQVTNIFYVPHAWHWGPIGEQYGRGPGPYHLWQFGAQECQY